MEGLEISIPAQILFEIYGFPVTNTFLLTLLGAIFIFFLFYIVLKNPKIIPQKLQNLVELILEGFYNYINSITVDKNKTETIFPLACTLFLLIFFANILELLPGVGVLHFLRSPSSDLNFTLGLALPSMALVHILAIKKIGLRHHLKKYFNFKGPIDFFVGILEGLSEITKILSLSIRLFGNLFAGEVLLIITSSLFAYFLPLPFLLMEIMVAFIQSLIFSSLIIIFYSVAVEIH